MTTGSRRGRLALDLVICAALLALGASVTTQSDAPTGAGAGTDWDTVLLPTLLVPVLFRRRAPFAAAVALAAGCVVSGIPTFDQFRLGVAVPAAMLVLYSLGRGTDRDRALGGLALVLAGMVFIGLTDVVLTDEGGVVAMVVFSFPLCIGTWSGGRLVRSRERVAEDLAERSRQLEQQREQTAELAVEVERTRLASELDAAARSRVREMIHLAERGERALGTDTGRTREAFADIERLGRESLNEMRGLLGLLRSDQRGTRSPSPTLAQIETLLADARAGGRLVDLEVEGERRPLPGGIELAAYRAVQHALGAVAGADGEPAVVQVRYLPSALELEVRGFPTAGSGAQAALVAARERVTAHGGSFSAHTVSRGRRVLRVQLPLAANHG
ncbi:MAG: sensor histidine kinase [Thermoleophilaceae bacterium]